jgi:hypothetical protein
LQYIENVLSYICLWWSMNFRVMSIMYYKKGGYLQVLRVLCRLYITILQIFFLLMYCWSDQPSNPFTVDTNYLWLLEPPRQLAVSPQPSLAPNRTLPAARQHCRVRRSRSPRNQPRDLPLQVGKCRARRSRMSKHLRRCPHHVGNSKPLTSQ